jgi:GNAT superfamily N-acetyltransferase
MSYSLREANLADLETLTYHRYAMWRDMGRDPRTLETVKSVALEYFLAAIPNGTYRGWVAECDGKIVGGAGIVVSAWPGNVGSTLASRAMILNMFVEPHYRRRGIARSLMEVMIAWCKSAGYSYVGLHASDEGRPLYESLGFQPTNEMRLNFT